MSSLDPPGILWVGSRRNRAFEDQVAAYSEAWLMVASTLGEAVTALEEFTIGVIVVDDGAAEVSALDVARDLGDTYDVPTILLCSQVDSFTVVEAAAIPTVMHVLPNTAPPALLAAAVTRILDARTDPSTPTPAAQHSWGRAPPFGMN